MKARDHIQNALYFMIDPFVRLLIRVGVTPNAVTTIGLVLNIFAAIIFIIGGEIGRPGNLSYIGWGCGLVLFAGMFDMLDGQVARKGNGSSRFGALYDSVIDRYSELIMFFGICYYLVSHHYFITSLIAFIALVGSMMVSYVRARAEGIGIECKGGFMQRPERIITIGFSGVITGILSAFSGGNQKVYIEGIPFHLMETMSLFFVALLAVALFSNITAINRLRCCHDKLMK
ncbi:MAG TPA: CDP-alcohol phosphatidyltransferase family protein [Lentimicrobium sp.]|nr:CDP-alcohol phosphatidyltransferase family protein [Lentimicrobium sp.]